MKTIQAIFKQYSSQLNYLDLELIIAHVLEKPREFVLTHPEYTLSKKESQKADKLIARRIGHEPIAYILGHKEFYGLEFLVNKHTLIPRPETELIVQQVLDLLRNMLRNKTSNCFVIDLGTGSGNIITSIAYEEIDATYCAIDISPEALKVAKKNAKSNNISKKIKFLQGSLLEPIMQSAKYNLQDADLIITANLPYLSKAIYNSAADNVKKYEPKSALYSPEQGLWHYRKLLEQLTALYKIHNIKSTNCFLEISPEQKQPIKSLIGSFFPKAKIKFTKDLAGKWRVCQIFI